ncbi:hypothetical protein LCGC14_1632200 [marine sediment metagenome]|uniref:Uncharacterized protein n=1 Tax=marine sediment metagenome TaxID=412755 RepID=A0A0F9L252_9ZZZZ
MRVEITGIQPYETVRADGSVRPTGNIRFEVKGKGEYAHWFKANGALGFLRGLGMKLWARSESDRSHL